VAAEIFPGRYQSQAMGLCSASTWTFNFLLAFFTPFITNDIKFAYGYVFAGCNLFVVFFVYCFLPETSGKSLEMIDTMFLLEVKPWQSSHWVPPEGEELVTADKLALDRGGRGINKKQEANVPEEGFAEKVRSAPGLGEDLPHVPVLTSQESRLGAGARGDSFAR
jgi:SP family sugar:H+ symporter-like MFS transporter